MTKKDLYATVTEKMIEDLEKGIIPWQKPWHNAFGMPFNMQSGKQYSILNSMTLDKGGAYATLKQWNQLGGKVRKGSKSRIIVFWTMLKKTEEQDGEMVEKKIPVLKYFNVFSLDQIEFNPEKMPEKVVKYLNGLAEKSRRFDHDRNKLADKILSAYAKRENVRIWTIESNSAYYSEADEMVVVPKLNQFERQEEFYSTLAHECTHSTGSQKRLKRDLTGRFGTKAYAREELTAEMGASFFLNMLGIETTRSHDNNVAYLQSWIQSLKEDNRAVIVAAGKAQKAIELIMDGKTVEEWEQEVKA